MRPDARVQSAIEMIDAWHAGDLGLDRVLTQWARSNRYAGSGDRVAIGDLLYGCIRRLRSSLWVSGHTTFTGGRAAMSGFLTQSGEDLDMLFSGARHAPEALTLDERNALRTLLDVPRPVRLDYPDWLEQHISSVPDECLDSLRHRAALDLRGNTLKTGTPNARGTWAKRGIEPRSGERRVGKVCVGSSIDVGVGDNCNKKKS